MASGEIRKVAVIGSGVMGSGIAAQIANAGLAVLLLDMAADGDDRSARAAAAIARMGKSDALTAPGNAALITPGNLDDDIGRVAGCDWIVEVVLERLDVKQDLYRRLDAVRRPGTPVSSNTSTIPLASLVDGMPDAFRRDFLVTHFFNPPRFMRLLEVVLGPDTDHATAQRVTRFADIHLGKSIVACHDSPGFIANRLGVYWLQRGVLDAIELGLGVEEADAVMGRPFGIPKTGIFGLLDLIGIDLMPHINKSLGALLPTTDALHPVLRDVPLIETMIADGRTGRKGKGGFYRMSKTADGRKSMEVIDLAAGSYGPVGGTDGGALKGAEKDLRALMERDDRLGRYAWQVMGHTLAYAAGLVPEAVGDLTGVDEAMRLGYNWKRGPFELIDAVGAPWLVERLRAEGAPVSPLLEQVGDRTFYRVADGRHQFFGLDGAYHDVRRAPGVFLLADIKLRSRPLLQNASAAVWDIGDGVLCFEFTGKGNALDGAVMALIHEAVDLVASRYRALVIGNDADHFCYGANLGDVVAAAEAGRFDEIETLIVAGQAAFQRLRQAPFPVVAAPAGMALGGGCEIVLCADAVQAHVELYAGLVECGVGLIPGWGGCAEMLLRWAVDPDLPKGPVPASAKVFSIVAPATRSKSAPDARALGILRDTDAVTMNRDRLLADAKAHALRLADGYSRPNERTIRLPGAAGRSAIEQAVAADHKRGALMEHDVTVANGLARVLTGGDTDANDELTEADLMALERETFVRLVRTPATLARIAHTLKTGKPLRN